VPCVREKRRRRNLLNGFRAGTPVMEIRRIVVTELHLLVIKIRSNRLSNNTILGVDAIRARREKKEDGGSHELCWKKKNPEDDSPLLNGRGL